MAVGNNYLSPAIAHLWSIKCNFPHHIQFIIHRFDCGSGIGKVVSAESVILNQWNTLIVYRYRWDAWILLNQGKRVQGRSKVKTSLIIKAPFYSPQFNVCI